MEIRQQQDRLDEILEAFAQVAAENPGIPTLDVCLGGLLCMNGRGETKAVASSTSVRRRTGSRASPWARSGRRGWSTPPTPPRRWRIAELGAVVLDLLTPFADEVAAADGDRARC